MGKGRKPLPAAIKKIRGSRMKGPDRVEIDLPADTVTAPAEVEGLELVEWNRIAPVLSSAGMLSKIDRAALVCYCTAWASFVRSKEELKKNGEVLQSAAGGYYQNPWLSIRNRQMEIMLKFLTEFGMSPSSRTKIQPEDMAAGDEIDQFNLRVHDNGG